MNDDLHEDELKTWLAEGKKLGATHMIVAFFPDDGNWDKPIYVMPGEDAKEKAKAYNVLEVYNFSLDIKTQLREARAIHY